MEAARLPSLTALRCFEAAARAASFSRAAEALHLTHGAISRAVRAIEDDLGVLLFERRSRRVFLTEAGRKLADAVREGFGVIETATRELRARSRDVPLVVSCEPTLLMRWLIPRLPAFHERHPDVPVHLVAGGGPVSLGSGIDLAIRRDDFTWPDHIHAVPLFKERIGPVCRADTVERFFEAGAAGPMRIRPATILLHTRSRPQAWDTWSTLAGRPCKTHSSQVFEHFYFSLQAAVAGIGVAIGPWHLVRDDLDSGILAAPFGFLEDGSGYSLLVPAAIKAGSSQSKLLDWLLAVCG